MKMRFRTNYLLTTTLSLLNGCGLGVSDLMPEISIPPVFEASPLEPARLELYLTGGTSEGSRFEQYKIIPSGLFVECGVVQRSLPHVEAQGLVDLEPGYQAGVESLVHEILEYDLESDERNPDEMYRAKRGEVSLKIGAGNRSKRFEPSLSELLRSEDEEWMRVRELLELVRGSTKKPACGVSSFHGLERRKIVVPQEEE